MFGSKNNQFHIESQLTKECIWVKCNFLFFSSSFLRNFLCNAIHISSYCVILCLIFHRTISVCSIRTLKCRQTLLFFEHTQNQWNCSVCDKWHDSAAIFENCTGNHIWFNLLLLQFLTSQPFERLLPYSPHAKMALRRHYWNYCFHFVAVNSFSTFPWILTLPNVCVSLVRLFLVGFSTLHTE